jgi:hypothetical protein
MHSALLAPLVTLAVLGAFHGVNPAMGWLFAVGLGLQRGRRSAVLRALLPIALGHAASVAAVAGVVVAASAVISPLALRIVGGASVLAVGLWRLARGTVHPRWVGMRVGFRDLTLWSFLMSSAHGAGLMLLPLLLPAGAGAQTHAAHGEHVMHAAGIANAAAHVPAAVVLGVHTSAMLAVMAVVALVVYEVFGVGFLRRAWVNSDTLWSAALASAGVITLAAAVSG